MLNRKSWHRSSTGHAVLVVVLLLGVVRSAAAGPSSPDDGCLTDNICLTHYNQAVKLFEEGRFEPALAAFQAAYHRRQMPWLLINIGRTLHRLGRPREALEYYERHRQAETKPDAETLERREKYTAQARALTEGNTAAAGEPTDNTTTTTTTTPAKDPVTPDPTAVSAAATATPAATVTTTAPQPEQKPLYKKWWFWTAIGGGVAAIAIIGVAAGVASSSHPSLPSGVTTITYKF